MQILQDLSAKNSFRRQDVVASIDSMRKIDGGWNIKKSGTVKVIGFFKRNFT